MRLLGTSYQEKLAEIDSHLAKGGTIPLNRYGNNSRIIVTGQSNTYETQDGELLGLGDEEVKKAYKHVKRHRIEGQPKA